MFAVRVGRSQVVPQQGRYQGHTRDASNANDAKSPMHTSLYALPASAKRLLSPAHVFIRLNVSVKPLTLRARQTRLDLADIFTHDIEQAAA